MKNMFEEIADVVETHVKAFEDKSKKETLEYFGLGSQGFQEIINDLKSHTWFKHKRKQVLEETIQKTIANYLHKSK